MRLSHLAVRYNPSDGHLLRRGCIFRECPFLFLMRANNVIMVEAVAKIDVNRGCGKPPGKTISARRRLARAVAFHQSTKHNLRSCCSQSRSSGHQSKLFVIHVSRSQSRGNLTDACATQHAFRETRTAVGEFAFTFAAWRAAVAWRLWRVPGASA